MNSHRGCSELLRTIALVTHPRKPAVENSNVRAGTNSLFSSGTREKQRQEVAVSAVWKRSVRIFRTLDSGMVWSNPRYLVR